MNVGECSGDCNLKFDVNSLYVHQIINLSADIAFGGIRAQMLNSRHKLYVKYSPGLKRVSLVTDWWKTAIAGRPEFSQCRYFLAGAQRKELKSIGIYCKRCIVLAP